MKSFVCTIGLCLLGWVSQGLAARAVSTLSPFSDANWRALGPFPGIPGVDGQVQAIAGDNAGNLFVAGSFMAAGDVPAQGIAKWDGHTWSALGSVEGGTILALAVSGTNLFVGGDFTKAGGVPASGIAKWDGKTWSALGSGIIDDTYAGVYALAVYGTNLYAGGIFTNAGGVAVNGVAKWDGSQWAGLGSGLSSGNSVFALAVVGQDLYVGGDFTEAGGTPAKNVAKWNGSVWSALGTGVVGTDGYGSVDAFAVSGSELYVAGSFTNAGGVAANSLAKWNGTSWSSVGGGPPGPRDVFISSLAFFNNSLYVAAPYWGPAKWDGTSWNSVEPLSGLSVFAVAGTNLYAGGGFSWTQTSPASGIAVWNGTKWSALNRGVGGGGGAFFIPAGVHAMAVSGTNIFVGGNFVELSGMEVNFIARWDGVSWSPLGAGVDGAVRALQMVGTNLYVGGDFFSAGGTPATFIARWDGANWHSVGGGLNNDVYAFASDGTNLFLAGDFTHASLMPLNRFAKWDGNSWSTLGAGFTDGDPNHGVYALAMTPEGLYVGGRFETIGGISATNIARWTGQSWSPLGPGVSDRVNTLAASGANLYVGGEFEFAGGLAVHGVASWSNGVWAALGQGVSINDQPGYVRALAPIGNELFVGGNFRTAGGVPANSLARWDGQNWWPVGSGVNNAVNAFATSPTSLYVGGNFTIAGDKVYAYIAEAKDILRPAIAAGDGNLGFGGGIFGFNLSGISGKRVVIQASADLVSWSSLQTNLLGNQPFYFMDTSATNYSRRYYRVGLLP